MFETAHFLPDSVVTSLRASSAEVFRSTYAGILLLLVAIDPDHPELLHGLTELLRIDGPIPPRLTVGGATEEIPRLNVISDRSDLLDPAQMAVLSRLDQAIHFIVPIVRQKQIDLREQRVNVGRSRDNDIVLAHPTVSAKHAWFEMDGGGLTIVDGRSRNGTRVNDRLLAHAEPNWLQPMDQICFGAVRSIVCVPAVLRGLLKLSTSG